MFSRETLPAAGWRPLPRLSPQRAGRRTLEQRVYVRMPAMYRVLAGLATRLPAGSRVRKAMVDRTVTLAYAAGNRRDFPVLLVGVDRAFEYRPSRDLMPPDLDEVFRGHEGYMQLWQYWMGAFSDIEWEPEEILDRGDRFVVAAQQRGHGSGSGVAVSKPVFQVFRLRRGLMVRQEDFLDRDEALAALDA
jgi:ketosteroid isomerase-like protein